MNVQNFDRNKCKVILRASQGRPAQLASSKARIAFKRNPPEVSPSRSGHALSEHLRGASASSNKTKFCNLNDMADALALALNSSAGQQALQKLEAGKREKFSIRLNRAFPVEMMIDKIGRVIFNRTDMTNAHLARISCFVALEGDSADALPHVQTFYPALSPTEVGLLLDVKTAPD